MPTISVSLLNIDQLTSSLGRAQKVINRTIRVAERLRETLQRPLSMSADTGQALNQMERARRRLQIARPVDIGVRIVVQNMGDIRAVRRRIDAELSTIRANIQVTLPTSINRMFTNLQRLVMRMQASIRRLSSINGNRGQPLPGPDAGLDQDNSDNESEQSNSTKGKGGARVKNVVGYLKGMAKSSLLFAGAQIVPAVAGSMEQQDLKDTFIARTGKEDVGTAMFEKFKQEALAMGQDVTQSLQGTLSLFPVTQNTDQLSQFNEVAAHLSAFDLSGGGIMDAASALKEALGGDVGSLAASYNIPEAELDKFNIGSFGPSNIDGFLQSLNQLMEQQKLGDQAYQTKMASPANQVKTLGNNAKSALADAGDSIVQSLLPVVSMLNQMFQQGQIQAFFHAMGTAIGWVTSLLAVLVQGALWFGGVIANNWGIFSSVLGGIAALIGMLLIPMLWSMIPPLAAIVAEWLLLNWPILAVAAFIGVVMFVLQKFGVTAADVIGAIVGAFTWLGGVIYNLIAVWWNYFASFAEFLKNLLIDPTYAIQKLFYDLATMFGGYMVNMLRNAEGFAGGFMETILGAINGILKGFNWLSKKIEKLTGVDLGTVDLFDTTNVHAMSERLQGMLDKLEKPVSDKSVVTVPRMEMKDLSNEYAYGAKAGSSFANSFHYKKPSVDNEVLDQWNSTQQPMATNGNRNINKVNEVGKINDQVDVSSEDLQTMRELAEMQNIQNFVTLQPQLSFGDTHIRQDGRSVDEIITNIKTRLQEELVSSARGVYG
ncbi:hypothetical protein H8B09_02625 [Paenibacillus sp. PR3]|uniref:Tail length tape measure protein n=1 Tax=Paenibacillus terricola TaxID=2763503 RepID=A0ABR8MNP5_9BACL|nr:hypothetical protein [Paenibacillus terricola]MBD3917633.1 hypothetical protein [Paenibacillus terricola]